MPGLPGEWAGEDEVVHGLGGLVAEEASCGVLQAAAGEAVGSPTSVQAGEPVEESDARGCPVLRGELPCVAACGTIEGGEVGRFGEVDTACVPLPDEAVWLVGEGRGVDGLPDL